MTPKEREAFYDAEVAPALKALAERCQSNGMSFLAVVEWEPGEQGRTFYQSAPSGLGIRFADAAAQANGNVDGLIMGIMKYAREHGHNSICLHQLGVPAKPAEAVHG